MEAEADGLLDSETLGEREGLALGLGLTDGEIDSLALGDSLGLTEGETEPLALGE